MSAHCSTHGCDLVYPEGTFPLGQCQECVLESALKDLWSYTVELEKRFAVWVATRPRTASFPRGGAELGARVLNLVGVAEPWEGNGLPT